MKVIVEKAFGYYSVGAVIPDMPIGQAHSLIARGLVREASTAVRDIPAATVDRMMRPARARKAQ